MELTPQHIRERFAAIGRPGIGERIARSAQTGLRLGRRLVQDDEVPIGASKFGGLPDLPRSTAWPKGPKRDLDFLCQISAEEARGWGADHLPSSGLILFFYDSKEQPWGLPDEDRTLWRVLHVPSEGLVRTLPPKHMLLRQRNAVLTPVARLVGSPRVTYRTSLLSLEEVQDEVVNDEFEELQSLIEEARGEGPCHMIGGLPDGVQNPPFECAEARVFGPLPPAAEAAVADGEDPYELAARARGWSLLLQLDSDDDLNWCWGDIGMLYFTVPRDESRAGRFEHCWMQLQCY
jgi:uncharacterized protein YwqG